jgi:hypothetical protein
LTRSRIEAFDQTADMLSQAATRWRARAEQLQRAANVYVEQVNRPNGVEWDGHGAATAFGTAHTDRLAVYPAVDPAQDMANIAERGSDGLRGARAGALQAITQAERDGFSVSEGLTVTDNTASNSPAQRTARLAAAVAHRDYISHHAALLQSENEGIAGKLGAGAAQMETMAPVQWGVKGSGAAPLDFRDDTRRETDTTSKQRGAIWAVDNQTWKQDPPPSPPNPGGMSREEAAERLRDVQKRIAEHNKDIPAISALPPNDPRRHDFTFETNSLNGEKDKYLAVLPPKTAPPEVTFRGERLPGAPPAAIADADPSITAKGWVYPIAPHQPGIDPRIATIRVMEPTSEYPNGYVVYMDDHDPPQTVNPFTGQTIPRTDKYAHIPLPKR